MNSAVQAGRLGAGRALEVLAVGKRVVRGHAAVAEPVGDVPLGVERHVAGDRELVARVVFGAGPVGGGVPEPECRAGLGPVSLALRFQAVWPACYAAIAVFGGVKDPSSKERSAAAIS